MTAARPSKWRTHPNLRFRPHSPNKGNGRIQRAIRRAFMVHGREITSSQAFDFALARFGTMDGAVASGGL